MKFNKLFNVVKPNRPGRNPFDLSHERKMSLNMGDLVPILVQDVLPGDKFKVRTESMLRLAPMLAPIMHRVNVYIHYFFVPNRLVWSNWEDFITGGVDGTEEPTYPKIEITSVNKGFYQKGSLSDYLGIPVNGGSVTQNLEASMLPFRAYHSIYNEYYRDQNLTDPVAINLGSSTYTGMTALKKRAWEKDYFTSALPWTQRGGEVTVPIGGEVTYTPEYLSTSNILNSDGSPPSSGNIAASGVGSLIDSGTTNSRIENIDSSTVYNVEDASLSINDLRESVALQRWLEANARGGARYIEQIFSHFGVISSDARLQRPEYLGGGKSPVVISEVLSQSETEDASGNPLGFTGDMAGHGISVGNTNKFEKYFEEHGYVMGIMSILPRTSYQQGLPRHFQKFDKLDYGWPEFANIGEQAILNGELYHDWSNTVDKDGTFGYQSRYAEYKYKESSVHGDFRDDLYHWHMGRIFDSAPALNTSFIESDPTHRIFTVETESVHKIYAQIYNDVLAIRPLPKYGTPRL